MPLPTINLPRETVTLSDGSAVEVRGLTRGEAYDMRDHAEDPRELEIRMLAYGTDVGLDEARAWHNTAPTAVIDPLVTAISRLSGLTEDEDGRPTESL